MKILPKRPDGFDMPPHVYIPGKTERHPDRLFDVIKQSVTPELRPDQLHHTQAWIAGLAYLEAGFFWECHEVLEVIWMQTPEQSAERDMVQAVIQLANARLKLLMDRPKAAARLCGMVYSHLDRCPSDRPVLGLRVAALEAAVRQTQRQTGMGKGAL
tara:strand:- start:257 stop:727 length:471 start_codon:yes stop_codon:yes gene_type:complete